MSRFNCSLCNAHKKCEGPICHTRVGKGPVELLIIGESPGEEEEQKAVPFIGRSGQLLRNTLETVTDNYILTNSRCCYGLKKPTLTELESCKMHWRKLIARYRPKVVCCLGQYSAKIVLDLKNVKMKNIVGVVSSVSILEKSFPVIVNFHPAYMLRISGAGTAESERAEDGWAETWELIEQLIKGKSPKLPNVRFIFDPGEIGSYLDVLRVNYDGDYSYDYETEGDVNALRPELNNSFQILCVGLSTELETVAFPLEYPSCRIPENKKNLGKVKTAWQSFLFSSQGRAIGQNVKYEHKCNLIKFGQAVKMSDTMLQMNLIDENLPANLGAIAKHCELSWAFYKKQMGNIPAKPLNVPLEKLLLYVGLDALAAFTCYRKQDEEIQEQHLGEVLEMVENIAYYLAFVEIAGMHIDGSVIAEIAPEFEKNAETILKKIHTYTSIKNTIDWAITNIKSWKGEAQVFNPKSPPQMKQLCIEELELPIDANYYSGSYDLGKKVLMKFEDKHPVIKDILKFRSIKSILSNFIAKWHLFTGPDNCIHTVYTQEVTATGRLSSKEMNLQNIPKDNVVRKSIQSRYKNGLLLSADYVQMELMIVAGMAGDRNMKKAFADGLDLHLYAASRLDRIDYNWLELKYKEGEKRAKDKRFRAKQMNLGTMYGLTEYGLSDYTGLTIKQSRDFIDSYNETFPELYEFRLELHKQAMTKGFVCDLFGRRRHLPDAHSSDRGKQNRALRQAGNFPGQSTANYFCLIALCVLKDLIRERNIRATIIGAEHDKLYIDFDREWQSQTLQATRDAMLVHNEMVYWQPKGIELKVDTKIGETLYEMEVI